MVKVGPSKTYWDRVASEKRFSHPLQLEWLARLENRHAWVLDYGCGYGRTLSELAVAGYQNIVGADFSAAMLSRAHNEVPLAELVQNDGHNLPFISEAFDLVLLFAVLTCIPNNSDQRTLLAEVERVLRPGGLVYISELLINEDARNRERYEQYAETYQCYGVFELPEGVVVRHHTEDWIDQLTDRFEKLEFEPFTVTTMNGNSSAAFQYLGRKAVGC